MQFALWLQACAAGRCMTTKWMIGNAGGNRGSCRLTIISVILAYLLLHLLSLTLCVSIPLPVSVPVPVCICACVSVCLFISHALSLPTQGKEGKPYKANSLYQFLRRLGFFPTEVFPFPLLPWFAALCLPCIFVAFYFFVS